MQSERMKLRLHVTDALLYRQIYWFCIFQMQSERMNLHLHVAEASLPPNLLRVRPKSS